MSKQRHGPKHSEVAGYRPWDAHYNTSTVVVGTGAMRRPPSGCKCGRRVEATRCARCGDLYCGACASYNHRGCRHIGR